MVPRYKYILTTLLASKAPTLGIGQVNFSSLFGFSDFAHMDICWFFFCVNQFWFLNLIWVHFLWKIISQVHQIITWVWSGQALSQLYPSLVNTKENLFGVQPPSFFIFEFALNANLLFGYLVPTLQRFHFDHQKSNFSLKSKYLFMQYYGYGTKFWLSKKSEAFTWIRLLHTWLCMNF